MLTLATVMVVDDEPRLRAGLAELFAAEGHWVVEAGDGDQALALLRGGAALPDAIFLDLKMPVRDGISTLQAIMAGDDTRAVPGGHRHVLWRKRADHHRHEARGP